MSYYDNKKWNAIIMWRNLKNILTMTLYAQNTEILTLFTKLANWSLWKIIKFHITLLFNKLIILFEKLDAIENNIKESLTKSDLGLFSSKSIYHYLDFWVTASKYSNALSAISFFRESISILYAEVNNRIFEDLNPLFSSIEKIQNKK
jgi:hypothetical protein